MCGNIPSCFAPLDDRGDRTNKLHWLKTPACLVHFSLRQAGKGKVLYSVEQCFETGANPRNIFVSMFVGILLRDLARDFGVEFERLHHHKIFEISAHADKKL